MTTTSARTPEPEVDMLAAPLEAAGQIIQQPPAEKQTQNQARPERPAKPPKAVTGVLLRKPLPSGTGRNQDKACLLATL